MVGKLWWTLVIQYSKLYSYSGPNEYINVKLAYQKWNKVECKNFQDQAVKRKV